MLDYLILHLLNGENSNTSIAVVAKEASFPIFLLALPKTHKTDAESDELRWSKRFVV
jgi:hypothetical protein